MNSESNICPQCGEGIPEGAPDGMCPKCLFAGAAEPTEAGTMPDTRPRPMPPSVQEIAAAFPQLEIIELIGQGGMGFVFRARQPKLERDVALKILPQHLADDPKFAERFAREGKLLAKLNHPNIVSIFDFGESGGFFYLLMEFVDGVNLRQAMRASKFTADQALSIVPKICEALQFAHEEGVLHRDIKPENILLDAKGRIKIADFGIAKMMEEGKGTSEHADNSTAQVETPPLLTPADSNLTVDGTSLGTPQYMAPEQLDEPASVDHRADIYSLGVVFYELLTGELPGGDFKPPSSKTPVDAEVDEVVARALAKERERRQQSAAEFKTQVETLGTKNQIDTEWKLDWKTPASIACVGFHVSLALVALASSAFGISASLYAALLFACILLIPVLWFVCSEKLRSIEKSGDRDALRRSRFWLRATGIAGWVLTIPCIGFGVFFLFAFMSELGSWKPHLFEAAFVTTCWMGMFLLPWAGATLLRDVISDSFWRQWPRKRVILGIALLIFGFIYPVTIIRKKAAVENAHQRHVHKQSVTIQSALQRAGQQKFQAQDVLNRWRTETANLSPAEKEIAYKNEGAALEAKLVAANTEFNKLQQSLSSIRNSPTPIGKYPATWFAVALGLVAIIAGISLIRVRRPRTRTPDTAVNPWPRRVFVLILLIICIPIGLLLIAILVPSLAYQSFETPRIANKFDEPIRQATLSETNTLKAPLVAGFVELVAVAQHPDKGQWWKPDGSYVGHMGFETHGSTTGHQPGNREYELVFKMVDLPDAASSLTLKLPKSSGWAGGGVRDVNGNNLAGYDMFSVALPEEIDTTDAQIGIAVDRWEEVHEHKGTGFSSISFNKLESNIALSWTGTTRGVERGIVQSVSHNLDRSTNQLRLVAILKDGSEKTSGKTGHFGDTITAEFHDVEFEDVKGFRLKSRPYTWINFPDVQLPSADSVQSISRSDTVYNQIQSSWLKGRWRVVSLNVPKTNPENNPDRLLAEKMVAQAMKDSVLSFDPNHMSTKSQTLDVNSGPYESFRIAPSGVIHLKFETEDYEIRCTSVDGQLMWEPLNGEEMSMILSRLPDTRKPESVRPSAQKLENLSTSGTAITSSNTFRAPIGSGFVELVAITHPPYTNRWWRPDGTYVGQIDFEMKSQRLLAQEGHRAHELAFRMVDLPSGSSSLVINVPQSKVLTGGGVRNDNGPHLHGRHWFTIELPEVIDSTDIEIGVATNQWEPVTTRPGTLGMTMPLTWKNKKYGMSWTETVRGNNHEIVQSYSHDLDIEANEFRVVAILKNGEEASGLEGRLGDIFTTRFYNVELEDVKGFRLEARPYEWINFPNVHLPEKTISNRDALLEMQIRVLLRLEPSKERDEALSHVARNAAESENINITWQALNEMQFTVAHDEAAAEFTRMLHGTGNTGHAQSIANSIVDTTIRDAVLKELAK